MARDKPIAQEKEAVLQITIVDTVPDKQAEVLSLMTERARHMERQPGFISINLFCSLDGRRVINQVQWQSRELLQQAHRSPEFRAKWGQFDQLTDDIDPHLYRIDQTLG